MAIIHMLAVLYTPALSLDSLCLSLAFPVIPQDTHVHKFAFKFYGFFEPGRA